MYTTVIFLIQIGCTSLTDQQDKQSESDWLLSALVSPLPLRTFYFLLLIYPLNNGNDLLSWGKSDMNIENPRDFICHHQYPAKNERKSMVNEKYSVCPQLSTSSPFLKGLINTRESNFIRIRVHNK